MRMLGRTGLLFGLIVAGRLAPVNAQTTGYEAFKVYLGAHGGATIFETQTQTKGAAPTAGVNLLITARRTGLLLAFEEGFKNNQGSSYSDQTAPGGSRQVLFNNVRKFSASVVMFPLRTIAQPYLGVGFGILQTAKEYPQGFFATQGTRETADSISNHLGTSTFAGLVGGVQFRVSRVMLFGQYQFTTSPPRRRLLVGPTHTFTAGLRFGLGNSREETTGGGY